jgi:orotidine-5'-phosphate decarboxylase
METESVVKKTNLQPVDRLIVALDVDGVEKAESLVKQLIPLGVTHFKVGLSLFTQAGPEAVERVTRNGGKVFLDLKFHDIPSTVARSLRAATQLGVWMVNLHIQGGSAMMRSAVAAVQQESRRLSKEPPLLIGVTVLTSMAQKDLADLGLRKTLKDQVLYLARLAQSAGLDGIVASAQEAKVLRWACTEDFLIVTPGIRPGEPSDPFVLGSGTGYRKVPGTDFKSDDQQRVTTPKEALQAGSDYLVIGRPIWEAPEPQAVIQTILNDCGGNTDAAQ